MDTCETPAPVNLDALPPWEQEAARPYASPWRALSRCFPTHKPVRQLPASPKTEDREPKTSLAPRARLKRLEQEAVEVLLLHMSCGVKSAFSLFRARCVRKRDGTLGLESAPKRKPRKPSKRRKKKSSAERRKLSRRARKAHASRVKRGQFRGHNTELPKTGGEGP